MKAVANLVRCLSYAGYAAEYESRVVVSRSDFGKWRNQVIAFMAGMIAIRWGE